MPGNIYLDLTAAFNAGGLRAVLSSGQAVVLYRLAVMSKDGDWILREDQDALAQVLRILGQRGARYRYGAPLDLRWLRGGWSAHLEFSWEGLRVRTDFVTRPPRLGADQLAQLWAEAALSDPPLPSPRLLVEIKKTMREKDYAVIGALARLLEDPREALRVSRSARDITDLARAHPGLAQALIPERPLLADIPRGREALEEALDRERRGFMRADERRLDAYRAASRPWSEAWSALQASIAQRPLDQAHAAMVAEAERLLPMDSPEMPLDA